MLEKSPRQRVGSAEMEELLKEDFYDNRDCRQLIGEPLLYGCAALLALIYVVFMMRDGLGTEWRRVYEDVSDEGLASDYEWDLRAIARRIRSWIDRWNGTATLRLKWGDSIASTNAHARVNGHFLVGHVGGNDVPPSTAHSRTELSTLQDGDTSFLNSTEKASQRRSIFPGATSARTAKTQPKPWDESHWIG
jgi:hypothetical protein